MNGRFGGVLVVLALTVIVIGLIAAWNRSRWPADHVSLPQTAQADALSSTGVPA